MSANSDIDALIRRLDTADAMPGAADLRARSYELLQPISDALVVDVGCGPLLLDAGFADVAVEVRTAVFTGTAMLPMLDGLAEAAKATGAVAGERTDAWIAEQTERARTDRMLLAVPMFVAAARRP